MNTSQVNAGAMNGPGNGKPVLLPHHLADLRRSGLSDEQIAACGFRSTTDRKEIGSILNWNGYNGRLGPCLVIPYFNPNGPFSGYSRIKPDRPLARKGQKGKAPKYESPVGQGNHAYFPPSFADALADPECPFLLTEGEKKAARADQEGFGCIGLPGVWSWAQKAEKDGYSKPRGGRKLIADLEAIDWRRRRVFLVYDSDAATNENVVWAEYYLAAELEKRGALVKVVRLPAGEGGKKAGLDDHLVAHGKEGLEALMQAAKEARPPAPAAQPKAKPLPPSLPYRPLPLACLPAPLDRFVEEGAAALGCDPGYLALPTLGVVAGCIGNTRLIELRNSWSEPAILWTALVAESGTLKSPAWRLAMRPLHKQQKLLFDEYKKAQDKFLEQIADFEADKKAKKPTGPRPKEPVLTHLLVSDTTAEALAGVLETCPRGSFLARDELGAWLTSFQRYKGGKTASDIHHWLELFHGGLLKIDRKTGDKKTVLVPRASVSVAGSITPGVMRQLMSEEHFDCGLAARMLLAMPPKLPKRWHELEVHPDTLQAYEELILGLLGLQGAENQGGEVVPLAVGLSAEAKGVWEEFYNKWADKQLAAEGELAAAYSKLEAYGARLALVHHVVTQVTQPPVNQAVKPLERVSAASVQAGCALAWWFAHEVDRIYTMFGETGQDRLRRQLVEFIRGQGGRVTARKVQRSNQKKYPTADDAEKALGELAQGGLGEWVVRPTTDRGGRPTAEFVLNPDPGELPQEGAEPEEDASPAEGDSSTDLSP
jgi:hypothetical protein